MNLEEYVKSEEFNQECTVQLRKAGKHASVSDNSSGSNYEDSIWSNSNNGTSSSVLSMEPLQVTLGPTLLGLTISH